MRSKIDCSWQASHLALNPGANQYTCPTYSTKVCFMAATAAGNITTSVSKGRQARPMSSLLPLDAMGQPYSDTSSYEENEYCVIWMRLSSVLVI